MDLAFFNIDVFKGTKALIKHVLLVTRHAIKEFHNWLWYSDFQVFWR